MGTAGGQRDPAQLRRMFGEVSGRYVLLNRIITFGQDVPWRRRLVEALGLPPGARLLDVGSGTGDILLAALGKDASLRPVALDFSMEMMKTGRGRKGALQMRWCCGDALALPFPDATFDGVVSGYLLRNVTDLRGALREQMRVVRPKGRIAALDTSPPGKGLLRPLVLLHLRFIIPLLGQVIGRNRAAYEYLPSSTRSFRQPEELARIMEEEGLKDVRFSRFMLGTQVILWGERGQG